MPAIYCLAGIAECVQRVLIENMSERRLVLPCAVILCAAALWADDAADRAKLAGKWKNADQSWTIEPKADTIRITAMKGEKTLADFECNSSGRDCNVKDGGSTAKVSLYFNGAKLVETETKGNEIVKRRFSVPENDAMEVEVIPVVPDGKTETLHFKRIAAEH